jgi:DNA repair protein RadC
VIIKLRDDQKKRRLRNADDAFYLMKGIFPSDDEIASAKEHFYVIGVSNNNKVIYVELVSLGSIRESIVHPMNVFRAAIMKAAVGIILVHNHPGEGIESYDLYPSEADNNVTARLLQAGMLLDIPVLEHLIISPTDYYSYEATGMLEALKPDSTNDPDNQYH